MNSSNTLSFDIESFEAAVNQNNSNLAMSMLRELLTFCDLFRDIEGGVVEDSVGQPHLLRGLHPIMDSMTLSQKQLYLQRLASAVSSLLGKTDLTLEHNDILLFLFCKDFLRCLFGATSYQNMDHILRYRGIMDQNRALGLKDEQDIVWLLICFTLESDIKIDIQFMLKEFPEYSLYAYIGCLYGNRVNLTEKCYNRLNEFIEAADKLPDINFNPALLDIIGSPWMLCSYIDHPQRHKIKSAINRLVKGWLERNLSDSVKASFSKNSERKGPIKRVAVFSEKYTSTHAMYRCYHKFIASLKSSYEVTLVTIKGEYDEVSAADFDHVIEFDYRSAGKDLMGIITRLSREKFDAIYYPSLGMASWTIIASNIRAARHQMMSLGHPASSFSSEMDYLIPLGMNVSKDKMQPFVSEKIPDVLMREEERNFSPHPQLEEFTKQVLPGLVKPDDGILRIAVNSSIMKVSKRFLEVCRIIEENSTVPLEFHFFPGVKVAFQSQFFETCIASYLSRFKVHPNKTYIEYMKELNQCDLAFGTFPFGGSNTNVDLSVLGIPKLIKHDHSDLAGYTDDAVSSIVGEVGFVTSDNEAGFMANAIYLIHDFKARHQISEQMKNNSVEQKLVTEESEGSSDYLLDVLSFIEGGVDNHSRNVIIEPSLC